MSTDAAESDAIRIGRPSKGDRVPACLRVNRALLDRFRREATRTGASQSDLLELILAARYSSLEPQEDAPTNA
jgi:hypothetical protein